MTQLNYFLLIVTLCFGLLSFRPAFAGNGEELYLFYCAQCHGITGKADGPNVTDDTPATPRNFTHAKDMNKLTDADLRNVIRDGGPAISKSPLLPPWSKTLTEEEIDELVTYIRVLCHCKGKQS